MGEKTKTNEYGIRANNVGVLIHADLIEDEAIEQIELIASHPAIRGLVAIMPDAHAGAGCVIGFTGRFDTAIIANIVGVDISCGVMTYKLDAEKIDYSVLDDYIRRNIPLGMTSRKNNWSTQEIFEGLDQDTRKDIKDTAIKAQVFLENYVLKSRPGVNITSPLLQIGTLGGGNHFIEIEQSELEGQNQLYLTIHSGSRNFGLRAANYYQDLAKKFTDEMHIKVPKGLEYLPMSSGGNDYLATAQIAQAYAHYNRLVMLNIILRHLGEDFDDQKMTESVHNYIAVRRDNIIRKGAISAHKGEKVVIPLNMGAGIVIGTGLGNERYNYSAPHGAGRLYGRKEMLRMLDKGEYSIEQFRDSMKGIFTTSIDRKTFDESPYAYKPYSSIEKHLKETVDIEEIAKPVYNLKAGE